MGIEPTPSAWKAEVLPLNYTRLITPKPGIRILSHISGHPITIDMLYDLIQAGGGGRIRTFEG